MTESAEETGNVGLVMALETKQRCCKVMCDIACSFVELPTKVFEQAERTARELQDEDALALYQAMKTAALAVKKYADRLDERKAARKKAAEEQ